MFGTEVAQLFVSIGADISGAIEGFTAVDASMASVGAGATMAGAALVAFGGAILGVESKGLVMGAQMDAMFTTIQNNTTMTGKDLDTLRQAVLQMGMDSGASFEQLAEGGKKAMNLTGDMAKSLVILDQAQKMAVSTGADVATVTNVLANAMHEYGADLGNVATVQQNAAEYMGVMHAAARMSNMDLQDFASHSGKAIGVAANLGIPLQDVAAGFVALTKHGYDAAQAQTQLLGAMTKMIAPTQAQQKELAKLSAATGVDLVSDFTATGLSAKGLDGVMGDLTMAFTKQGYSQAAATGEAMHLIAAMRGGMGLATLLGTGATDYADALSYLSDKQQMASLTAEVYDRWQQTGVAQWQVLQRRIEEAMMVIGSALGPVAEIVGSFVKDMVDGFLALPGPIQSMIATFAAAAGALMVLAGGFLLLEPVLAIVGPMLLDLALPIAGLMATVAALKQGWDEDFGGIQATVKIFTQTVADLWENGLLPAFKGVASFLEDRVFPLFGKLAFSVLADVLNVASMLAREWETILIPALQQTGQFLEDKVFPSFEWLVNNIVPLVGQAITWLANRWQDTLLPGIQSVMQWIGDHVGPIWEWIADNVIPRVGAAAQWLGDRWNDTLLPALQATGEFIQSHVMPFLSWLADTGLAAVGAAAQALADLWTGTLGPAFERFGGFVQSEVVPVLGQLVGAVGDKLPVVIAGLTDVWNTFLPVLQSFGQLLQSQVLPVLHDLGQAIIDQLEPAFRTLVGWFQALPQPVKDFLATAAAVVVVGIGLAAAFLAIAAVAAPVVALFGAMLAPIGAVLGVTTGLFGAVIGIGAALVGIAVPIGVAIGAVLLLKTAWDNDWGQIQERTRGAVDAIAGFWNNNLLPALQNFGSFLQQHVFPFVEALANLFTAVLGKAVQGLVDLWNGPLQEAFKATGKWLGDFVQGPLKSLIDWIAGIAKAVLDNPVLQAALGGAANDLQVFVNSIPGAIDQATAATNAAAASTRASTQTGTVIVNQTNHGVDPSTADQVADGTGGAVLDAMFSVFSNGAPSAPVGAGGAF